MKLFLIALAFCANAHAFDSPKPEFDIDLGVTKFRSSEGLWYVSTFEHELKLTSPSGSVGVTFNLIDGENYGLDIRGAFVYFGSAHTHALVPSFKTNVREGGFVGNDFKGAVPDPCYGECTHMSTFTGTGSDRGVALTLEPYWRHAGAKYSFIIGPVYHKSTWNVDVLGLNASANDPDYNAHVEYKVGWRPGATIGVSYKKGNIVIRYQWFYLPPKRHDEQGIDTYPPAWTSLHMFSIGIRF